ncbi:MAG: MBL fold metallo-hydrolase [Pseudomonadota bacterium]
MTEPTRVPEARITCRSAVIAATSAPTAPDTATRITARQDPTTPTDAATETGLDVRVWGARGSIPFTGPDVLRYGGDTPGVELRLPDRVVYFDAGSAAPRSGKAILADGIREIDLFLSHVHYDHIMGMPFFAPIFSPDVRLRVWYGGAKTDEGVKAVIGRYFEPPYFPASLNCIRADISFHAFRPGDELDVGDVRMETAPLRHPDGATGFRAERGGASFAYITDFEQDGDWGDASVVKLGRDADLAFLDATFTPDDYFPCAGWGHAHWRACGELAARAGAKRWGLFHHKHDRTDAALDKIVAEAQAEFPNAFGVAAGQRFGLPGARTAARPPAPRIAVTA